VFDSIVKEIWLEELQRSKEILEINEQRLQALPKGSIQPRKRRNGVYYYLFFRDGKRVKSNYLGSDPVKIEAVQKQIARRKALELSIRRTRNDIRLLEKAVKLK
jgi:hypothetical protein